jgi:hypothetical protein
VTTGGDDDYRMNLAGDIVASIGDTVETKTGSMAGPTTQGLTARVGGGFQPVSSIVRFDADGGATLLDEDSPQLVKLPMVEKLGGTTVWPSGSGNVRAVGFAYFAISGMGSEGKEVSGVFVRAQSPPGTGNGTTGAWNPASTLYAVQLTR